MHIILWIMIKLNLYNSQYVFLETLIRNGFYQFRSDRDNQ